MKSFVIGLAFILFGKVSLCQDWYYVGVDKDGDKWYVKSSYVKKEDDYGSGENIKIWTKKELKKTTIKRKGKSLTYTNAKELQLILANCSDKRIKVITTTVYNSQGNVIVNYTYEDYEQEWIDIVPDSVGESVLNKICELFN